jgi:hypothetical protein
MNLYDIVKRKDALASFDPKFVLSTNIRLSNGLERCVLISPNGSLDLTNADHIHSLRTFPREIGWTVIPPSSGFSELSIRQIGRMGEAYPQADLNLIRLEAHDYPRQVTLNWPAWSGTKTGYDLQILNSGSSDAIISVGPLYSARKELVACLSGNGIEIGPGANPAVKRSESVSVKYVESMPIEKWFEVYAKNSADTASQDLWGSYEVASAQKLDSFDDNSLDFIFSSHVFEHLVNPIGVLINWYKKLSYKGVIAAVIPDCRYTFDLRQTPSSRDEWLDEFQSGMWDLDLKHYKRWCEFTEIRSNVQSLLRRNYSVHAHYYTPDSFLSLVKQVFKDEDLQEVLVLTSLNSKDFGVLLKKRSY